MEACPLQLAKDHDHDQSYQYDPSFSLAREQATSSRQLVMQRMEQFY